MLTVNYNSTDLSIKLEEFSLPVVPITLLVGEFIYIGYYKPITNFHAEFNNTVESLSNLIFKYETASGFTNVSGLVDRTNGLGSSGKISWDATIDGVKATRFGKELYWYQLSVNIDTEERNFVGINALFSNDNDLVEEYPGILDELPEEATSFVNFHASARKDIVQALRKLYSADSKLLTAFDLLNNEEVHQASKYLTLSKVMTWLSENPQDKWAEKAPKHYEKYVDYLNSVTVTIDSDDDGAIDDTENTPIAINYVTLVRY